MEIAILGYQRKRRDDVEGNLRACLGEDSPVLLRQYGMEEPLYNPAPEQIAVVFIIVDDARALTAAKKAAEWGKDLPLVMVSNHPQYAMEGIRLKVRHYILFPLEQEDIREALQRVGLGVGKGWKES
ncbi:MAG TPA: hypothetical protein GXX75_21690 [Clostridiales bacterium]|nr:hypothetical protein [Clostridiales bacterium]